MPQLHDFTGVWALSRRILLADGTEGRFSGQAVFAPEGAGLRYHEAGQLRVSGAAMQAERSYLWHAEGDQIVVRFADGRAFHRFTPAAPHATHWCAPDDYRVSYDFSRWPVWAATWRVSGPRKEYVLLSHYHRG